MVVQDQFVCDLRGAIGVGLGILGDNRHGIGLATNLKASAQLRHDRAHDEFVGLAKKRQRTGFWADITKLEGSRLRDGRHERPRERQGTGR